MGRQLDTSELIELSNLIAEGESIIKESLSKLELHELASLGMDISDSDSIPPHCQELAMVALTWFINKEMWSKQNIV